MPPDPAPGVIRFCSCSPFFFVGDDRLIHSRYPSYLPRQSHTCALSPPLLVLSLRRAAALLPDAVPVCMYTTPPVPAPQYGNLLPRSIVAPRPVRLPLTVALEAAPADATAPKLAWPARAEEAVHLVVVIVPGSAPRPGPHPLVRGRERGVSEAGEIGERLGLLENVVKGLPLLLHGLALRLDARDALLQLPDDGLGARGPGGVGVGVGFGPGLSVLSIVRHRPQQTSRHDAPLLELGGHGGHVLYAHVPPDGALDAEQAPALVQPPAQEPL